MLRLDRVEHGGLRAEVVGVELHGRDLGAGAADRRGLGGQVVRAPRGEHDGPGATGGGEAAGERHPDLAAATEDEHDRRG